MIQKNRRPKSQSWRALSQLLFLFLVLAIGVQFFFYVGWLDSGGLGEPPRRPPGAEAFLPIASLMSLNYLFQTGSVHLVHAAGLYLFIAFLLMSWFAGKSFCSWVCPFGFISESLEVVHRRLFKKMFSLPRWLDYPLRSLKYLLLAFFALAVMSMGAQELLQYLDSPYHAVADIKMYRFFAHLSAFSLIVILILVGLSFVIPYFWCRYLCPYGALLGFIGLFSPNRIVRNPESCTDCGKCTRVCPARILVDKNRIVVSDECSSCYQCVDACPVADTLEIVNYPGKRRLAPRLMGAGVVLIFFGLAGLALFNGHWQSSVSAQETLRLYPGIDTYIHTD